MRIAHYIRKRAWILPMVLVLVAALTVTSMASSDKNTDTDTGPVDGYYTFTGNGDWYGYTSYLNLDGEDNTVSGRQYEVTLPADGRIQVELSTQDRAVFIDVGILTREDRTFHDDPEWMFGSVDAPISVNKKSGILKAGTYDVNFVYNRTNKDLLLYWPPGYHEFYHKLTFVALSADEQTAFNVVKAVDALPDSSKISLSDEAAVNSANSSYTALTGAQKSYVPEKTKSKLTGCVDSLAALKAQKAAADAYNKKVSKAKSIKVKGVKASALKGRKVTVRWTKAAGVSGYQIQYSRSKSFKSGVKKKKITKSSTRKATLKSFKAGKTWYFRVRSYTKIKSPSGTTVTKYGKWSAVRKCKIKK